MSLLIQIQQQKLLAIIENTIQSRLIGACTEPFPPFYFDHANVSNSNPPVITYHDNIAEIHVYIDFFLVDESSLQSNINGTPPGAETRFGLADLMLELSIVGAKLVIQTTDVKVSPPSNQIAQPIKDRLQTRVEADLGVIWSKLEFPQPQSHLVTSIGNTLLITFDPNQNIPRGDHLQVGHDWSIYIHNTLILDMVMRNLQGVYQSLRENLVEAYPAIIRWRPKGITPHLDVRIAFGQRGKVEHIPYSVQGALYLGVDFSLAPPRPQLGESATALQQLIEWDIRDIRLEVVDIGAPSFIEDKIRKRIISAVKVPEQATPVADQQFMFKQQLQALSLGPASFSYKSIAADSGGMTIAGEIIKPEDPPKAQPRFQVNSFPDRFKQYVYCNSGRRTAVRSEISVTATVILTDAGDLCGVDFVSPTSSEYDLRALLFTSSFDVALVLPPAAATVINASKKPVLIRIRTSRGVRLVDLGVPPAAIFDGAGKTTNVDLQFMGECFPVKVIDPWILHFGHLFNPKWHIDPPPVWVDSISKVAAFQSSLVMVTGVRAGDMIRLNQPLDGGASVFTATASASTVTIPMLAAVRSFDEGLSLENLSRSALGPVHVSSRLFERKVLLKTPNALSHKIFEHQSLGAKIITLYRTHEEITTIDELGVIATSRTTRVYPNGSEMVDNGSAPSSVTPGCCEDEQGDIRKHEELRVGNNFGIPSCRATYCVPGFEDRSDVMVAEMDDGTYRVIHNNADDDSVRVTGTVARWPKNALSVIAGWAMGSTLSHDEVAVFSIQERTSEFSTGAIVQKKPCCEDCAVKNNGHSRVTSANGQIPVGMVSGDNPQAG